MAIHAILQPPEGAGTQRTAPRLHLRLETAGEVEKGGQTAVVIHNLSASGLLIETQSPLETGQKIRIDLPETAPVSATVVWQSFPLFGCRFDHLLPRAVISAIQLRNPLPTDFDPVAQPLASPFEHEPLAARIFRLRRERGLSRTVLAAQTGLSKPSIWAWETGKSAPRRNSVALLANAFGISERELLTGKSMPAPESDTPRTLSGVDGKSVQEVIQASKNILSKMTGVAEDQIRIIIEY